MPTIFSKIIDQTIPSLKIYENNYVYAFLDINPIEKGHTLIVPKIEVDYFVDLPDDFYQEVFKVAKYLSKAIQKSIDSCERVSLLVEGREVPHFHLHLIPLIENKAFDLSRIKIENSEMLEIQEKILTNLE